MGDEQRSLAGRRVLVTGASSGIGAATAVLLAERGATVGLVARRVDRLAGGPFETYVPDLKSVVEFKATDADAYLASAAAFRDAAS